MVDRLAIKEWSKLKYQDPKIILLKLKELGIIASNYQIDMKVRNFRTNSLKCYREGREAAIFCYGMGKAVVHTPVYFAIVENADYDCVARCQYGFTPLQIKELVPEYLNRYCQQFCVNSFSAICLKKGRLSFTFPTGVALQANSIFNEINANSL